MRLFLVNWSGRHLGMINATKAIAKKHSIVYWTCPNIAFELDTNDFPQTIFHEHGDALLGIAPKEARSLVLPPPSAEVIAKLHETESTVLTMMNKRFECMSHTERKRLYLSYVRYWLGALKEWKPDVIIFPATPHAYYDYVIYGLAKMLCIKTVIIEPIWVKDRLILMHDYKEGGIFPKRESRQVSFKELSFDIQDYYRRAVDPSRDRTPFYMQVQRKRFTGISLFRIRLRAALRSVTDASFLPKTWNFLSRKFGENLIREYKTLELRPDLAQKFVYVALHFQPERTTCPQGGVFVDQILMVETLSVALPKDWIIYVKEHPMQWMWRGNTYFSYRFKGYYKKLAALPNVRLIPVETDSFTLIEKCHAIATIAGTVGFEGVLNGKPALIFGYPWYMEAPGVFKVSSVEECASAFATLTGGFVSQKDAVIQYLGALDRQTFSGFVDDNGQKMSLLTLQENAEALAGAIERGLTNNARR